MRKARHGRKCPHYNCNQALQVRDDRYWCRGCDRKYADLVLQDTGQPRHLLPGAGEFFACTLCAHPLLLQMDTYDQLFYWHCDVCDMSWSLGMRETVHRTAIPVNGGDDGVPHTEEDDQNGDSADED